MNIIIQHKWNFSISMMMFFLLFIGACKKDKAESPVVAFKIDSYYPNSGNAGTLVTVAGAGFGTDISHYSASISGKGAEVISATATHLVIRMPEGGTRGLLSLKYDGQSFDIGQYSYQDLSVTAVSPANGPAGSQIRISGEGFSSTEGPATVFINGKQALVVSVSDELIVAEVPADAGYGPIVVKVNGEESQGQNFTYQAIDGIKPLSGGKNTRVTISGAGFEELAADNQVEFNGTIATVLEATKERLVVLAPDGVTTGPLSVNINGQKTTGPNFTVVAPPAIQVVTPLSGPKGTEMSISGAFFSEVLDENMVYINNVLVPVLSASEGELKLMLPGGTGSGSVKVVVNDQATVGPQFKDQTLGILSVSPDNGLAGTTVTIKGSGFSAALSDNKVYFNGVLATVKTASENTLVLDAPAGLSTGDLKVVVDNQEALAPQQFKRAGVITIAGGPNSSDFGLYMSGIAIDDNGVVYVADKMNKVVKKIATDGTVSVLQANGVDATFEAPYAIVFDKLHNIYVADQLRNQIIKITPSGQRTVFASGFSPGSMTFDNAGNLYVNIVTYFAGMNKVNSAGGYTKVNGPNYITARTVVDKTGNLFYVDASPAEDNGVSRLNTVGSIDSYWVGSYETGFVDGVGRQARFNNISGGLAMYGDGKLIAGDRYNYAIREIDIATKKVSTLVKLSNGFADGSFQTAKFGSINDMVVDKDGNIYVLDATNKAVRKVFLK